MPPNDWLTHKISRNIRKECVEKNPHPLNYLNKGKHLYMSANNSEREGIAEIYDYFPTNVSTK